MDAIILPPAAVAWIARHQALPVPAGADAETLRALLEVLVLESAMEVPSRQGPTRSS